MDFENKIVEHWNKRELEKLIENEIEESIYLEYKACAALQTRYFITIRDGEKVERKKSKSGIIKEVSKDVSAFANSDGGTIIYGIHESGHKPLALDKGFDQSVVSKEWLEQVINSNIKRRIPGVVIIPVDVGSDRFAYVVEIPKSQQAPHMAKDNRFYKRYNFQVLPMEEYEVREIMNRGLYPVLKMQLPKIIIDRENNVLCLIFTIKNEGRAVAKYCDLIVHFEKKYELVVKDEEWKDLSGNKPRSKLRWSYERVIHPGLRISTPALQMLNIPSRNFRVTANLYAERMEMKVFVYEVDVSNLNEPKIKVVMK